MPYQRLAMARPLAAQPACDTSLAAPLPEAEHIVYLSVRIPPPQILNFFLALFERFPVRILEAGRGDTTVQVRLPHSALDMAMDAVMQALPRAEFGVIRRKDAP